MGEALPSPHDFVGDLNDLGAQTFDLRLDLAGNLLSC